MTSPKFSMKLFASLLSVVMVVAMILGVGFYLTTSTHASHAASVKFHGKPHFFHFAGNASDAAVATAHLKHWNSTFTSGGKTYKYTMVGTNPAKSNVTTTIPVTIVPIKLTFSDNTIFDGTQKVANTTASPIFQPAAFSSGTTQYGDAIQRAEFWKSVQAHANYHVLLGTPTITPTVNVTVPAADGSTTTTKGGLTIGLMDINWFDSQIIQPMLASQHFTANMLPIFLTNNVFLYQGSTSNCCIIGYHNAVKNAAGLQTYIWSTNNDPGVFTQPIEDIHALSHEVSEWYNDPFVNNAVPPWSVPSQPQYGCTKVLEVGDPLVGVAFVVNGYHPQDEAFFSWFAREQPSQGINGQYTYLGTFTTFSPAC